MPSVSYFVVEFCKPILKKYPYTIKDFDIVKARFLSRFVTPRHEGYSRIRLQATLSKNHRYKHNVT